MAAHWVLIQRGRLLPKGHLPAMGGQQHDSAMLRSEGAAERDRQEARPGGRSRGPPININTTSHTRRPWLHHHRRKRSKTRSNKAASPFYDILHARTLQLKSSKLGSIVSGMPSCSVKKVWQGALHLRAWAGERAGEEGLAGRLAAASTAGRGGGGPRGGQVGWHALTAARLLPACRLAARLPFQNCSQVGAHRHAAALRQVATPLNLDAAHLLLPVHLHGHRLHGSHLAVGAAKGVQRWAHRQLPRMPYTFSDGSPGGPSPERHLPTLCLPAT